MGTLKTMGPDFSIVYPQGGVTRGERLVGGPCRSSFFTAGHFRASAKL